MEDRRTGTKIDFSMFDVTAKDDSQITVTDKQPFIDLSQLKEEEMVVPTYATLELNQCILDSSTTLIPQDTSSCRFGWWSLKMSDADGRFENPPVLTVDFLASHSSMGLTFRFLEGSNDYPTRMRIQWYDGNGGLLADEEYRPDAPMYYAEQIVFEYRKIVVTFYETNKPFRYLKLTEIMYGAYCYFDDSSLISANIMEDMDPTSTQVTYHTLDFKFHDATGRFSILDMQGVFSLFQRRQKVRVRSYLNDREIPMGTFFLEEPESESENITEMHCIDILGVIDQTEFMGGMYEDVLLSEILQEIGTSARATIQIDPVFDGVKLSGWIPICTHREALQLAAVAVGAMIDSSRGDAIVLRPLPSSIEDTVTQQRKFTGHSITQQPVVTGLEVSAYQYSQDDAGQEKELQNGRLQAGEHKILFSEPMYNLRVRGAAIKETHVNYAVLEVAREGEVTLQGQSYLSTVSVYGVYQPNLPGSEIPNVKQVDGITLIGPDMAESVAQRLYDYCQMRYVDEGEILLEGERIGEMLLMDSQRNNQIQGIVQSLDIDLVGGYRAKMKIRGKAVR